MRNDRVTATTPRGDGSGGEPRLRPHALGFPTLLAQSVAVISPTMTAVLIIPLAFLDAGQGTWAAYLFATIMLLFVVLGLNQFARRSASAGQSPKCSSSPARAPSLIRCIAHRHSS